LSILPLNGSIYNNLRLYNDNANGNTKEERSFEERPAAVY